MKVLKAYFFGWGLGVLALVVANYATATVYKPSETHVWLHKHEYPMSFEQLKATLESIPNWQNQVVVLETIEP